MRVLQVGKYYPPYRGGMETVLENLGLGLAERGHRVSVLVAGQEPQDRFTGQNGAPPWGPVRLWRAANFGTFHSQPLTPTLYSLLRREIAHFRPDLVHLHFPNPLAAGAWWLVSRELGERTPPLAIWYHADVMRRRLAVPVIAPFIHSCLRQAAGICVSSANLIAHSRVLAEHQGNVTVVPFGIAAEPWVNIRPVGREYFLFIGRLVPYKGLVTLLSAVAGLPAARLVIAGQGPQQPDLRERIRRLGLAERVQLVGEVSPREMQTWLTGARALILPSLDSSETFGLVQLEAMAAGVPVVASQLPTGVSEINLHGETGLLVPPGDVSAWTKALGTLLADDAQVRRWGERARVRFLSGFTRDHMLDLLEPWYGSLVAKAAAGGGRR